MCNNVENARDNYGISVWEAWIVKLTVIVHKQYS